MNTKLVYKIIAITVIIESFFMIPAMLISAFNKENKAAISFAITIGIMLVINVPIYFCIKSRKKGFYAQEGFVTTGLAWIVMSFFGALPFWISGEIPSFIDCWFEIVSGFTTTGASILNDIESLSKGILYWRSFSHWLGGMGVLVFVLAIIPKVNEKSGSSVHLLKAESPGPSVSKFTPHMHKTALTLYVIYIVLTVLCVVFLLAGGMPFFDSICTAFGTAGTGGFGIKNDSMAGYSPYLQNVTSVFMLLFGVNFNIYFLLLIKKFKEVFIDEELRMYLCVIAASTVLISFDVRYLYSDWFETIRHSFFQVSSIITTTGFSTVDFDIWPSFSKAIILILMCFGACAGSTGGGIKIARVLLLFKCLKRNIHQALHPHRVEVIQVNKHTVDEHTIRNVHSYLSSYCVLVLFSILIIALDGQSTGTNISAVLACFNNIGPGLEAVGATCNYSVYGTLSKFILSLDMLLGRLEIYPILVLISKSTWSRKQ